MTYQNASHAMPNFRQPEFYKTIKFLSGKNLNTASTYFMTMTALTLGMDCVFERSQMGKVPSDLADRKASISHLKYKVSSRQDCREFLGSIAMDLVNPRMAELTKSKVHTRRALNAAGIQTAAGGLAWAENMSVLDQISAAGVKRVLVKPNKGSTARGVVPNITIEQARKHIKEHPGSAFIVEQFIVGTEYRIYVVGGKLNECYAKLHDEVVGDSKTTLRNLLRQKFTKQVANPYCSAIEEWYPEKEKFLIAAGYDLDTVLPENKRVCLNNRQRPTGRDGVYLMRDMDSTTKALTRKIAKTVGADFGAIDLIHTPEKGAFILEFNAKPGIAAPCIPFNAPMNLRLPEAILRNVFPNHQGRIRRIKRYHFLRLLMDYAQQTDRNAFHASDYAEFE